MGILVCVEHLVLDLVVTRSWCCWEPPSFVEFAPTLCEGIAASTGLDSGEVKTPLWGFHEE